MPAAPVNRGRTNGGGNILRGILLLAFGQAKGIEEFGNTPDALTAALAPLIAFPLVGAGLVALSGQPLAAGLAFLARLCGVLVLPVTTQLYAKYTGREAFWFRTATALSWSFWLLIPLLLVAAFIGALLVGAGVKEGRAEQVVVVVLACYILWLHWFIARAGLRCSGWLAAGLVLVTNCAVGLLTFGPDLLNLALGK
jgi:hypothetical protein